MWRKLLGAVVLLIGGVLAFESAVGEVVIWDGWYDFTIHLDTPTDPPSAVGCRAFGRLDEAERIAGLCRKGSPPFPLAEFFDHAFGTLVNPYTGEPLKVRVPVSGRQSVLGRELSRSQHDALVVGAEWPDGRRVWKVVEIPDGRVSKEVRVSLP
jgi:hypothetical protein